VGRARRKKEKRGLKPALPGGGPLLGRALGVILYKAKKGFAFDSPGKGRGGGFCVMPVSSREVSRGGGGGEEVS